MVVRWGLVAQNRVRRVCQRWVRCCWWSYQRVVMARAVVHAVRARGCRRRRRWVWCAAASSGEAWVWTVAESRGSGAAWPWCGHSSRWGGGCTQAVWVAPRLWWRVHRVQARRGCCAALSRFQRAAALGVVRVVVGGEAGQCARQVGEWGAGRDSEVVGRVEVEFGGRWCAVAVEGDAGAVEELGQRQMVGVGEALGVGGGCFAGQWPYAEHARCG